jgi:hypothetical protein
VWKTAILMRFGVTVVEDDLLVWVWRICGVGYWR